MKRSVHLLLASAAIAAIGGCTTTSNGTAPRANEAASNAPRAAGIDLEGMKRSVRPGDNFFAYANGGWIDRTEIPADRSVYGVGAILAEQTQQETAELIRNAAAHAPAGSEARKIGDTYESFMDEAAIEARGLDPLRPTLAAIAAVSDQKSLSAFLGSRLRADVDVLNATHLHTDNLFGLWVAQDLNDPTRYSPFILQGGLGMPDRDYYLNASPRMAGIRARYQAHVAAMLKLAGETAPEEKADRIVALEKKIAGTHASHLDSEDVPKGNNPWKRGEFDTRAPGMDWSSYFSAAGLGSQQDFVVWQPTAVTGISALVRSEPLQTWKDYLTFHAIERAANFLPKAFVDEGFSFYGKTLTGTPRLRDRWKRAMAITDEALGQAVGKLFVEKYFSAAEKHRAEVMVQNVIAAFRRRIDALTWMAPETKAQAKAKLGALKVGVGYPDKWRDYSGLEVIKGDALGNNERASLFEYRRNLAKLGQPVDRGEWVMNPQLVNAVNLPAMNALNFPAAILRPPHFDPSRPEVMDYGSAGAIIGHEISHSFDNEGALFDATGKVSNWWTKEDFAHFQASAERLIQQFDAYHPFPDLAVNGRQTSGENIADVAGLAAAYDAYRMSLGGAEAPAVDGLTGDQQFFLSFAQAWRQKVREPALRQLLIVDGHAPAEYRADTVRNLDAWYPAFDVKPGQALFLAPQDRVRVW